LYNGFFNTGAYQETIGGYGGLHHCLIPQPKHILIDRDENGILATEVFRTTNLRGCKNFRLRQKIKNNTVSQFKIHYIYMYSLN
jgi:hypothetical protein